MSTVCEFLIFIVLTNAVVVFSNFDPCTSRGYIGDNCDKNDDCQGFAVVCMLGKCQCHWDYSERTESTLNTKFCVKMPDRIDSNCIDSCKLPMFCNNGKCECIRSIIVDNDICQAESSLGLSCTKNYECVSPFSSCQHGSCRCIAGTTQVGTTCQAEIHCPTGAKPSGACIRNAMSADFIHNFANSGSQADNCSDEYQYCYSTASSYHGVCCPATCPLGQTPERIYTCDPNQASKNKSFCPDETHFCHRAAGLSYSSTVCCRRPCSDAAPLLIKGTCYPRAFLNGPCSIDDQCDGNYGMKCVNKICQCKPGFKPYVENATNAEENPAQICVRICKLGDEIEFKGECFKSQLSVMQQQCAVDKQCPQNSKCKRGLCFCDCDKGFFSTNNNKGCATVEPRTVKPVGGVTTAPGNIIDLIKSIFGPPG